METITSNYIHEHFNCIYVQLWQVKERGNLYSEYGSVPPRNTRGLCWHGTVVNWSLCLVSKLGGESIRCEKCGGGAWRLAVGGVAHFKYLFFFVSSHFENPHTCDAMKPYIIHHWHYHLYSLINCSNISCKAEKLDTINFWLKYFLQSMK